MEKEAILARMHELIPGQKWLDLGYMSGPSYRDCADTDAFAEGRPFISDDIQRFAPLSRQEIADLKEWLDLCLELYPPEIEIAHINYRYCGNESCEVCYQRERSRFSIRGRRRFSGEIRPGFVVLFRVRDVYGLFAAAQPQRRLRAIEREWSESLQLVHRIETNDQTRLKELWESNFQDFSIPFSDFFRLSDRALNTFRGCQFQTIDRTQTWKENMAAVDLYDVTQLPRLAARNREWDKRAREGKAVEEASCDQELTS